jgi:two-component system phosphate regulon sensor histidine kinase PhoR
VPKFQIKLVLALSGLVLVVIALVGVLAERRLRARTVAEIERSLFERAELVRVSLRDIPLEPAYREELDAVADRTGRVAHARVTLIGADGWVLGDSEIPVGELSEVENHADRPEVALAIRGERGRSSRRSTTVKRNLLYVGIASGTGSQKGVVRLAVDLASVDAAAWELRRILFGAAGLGVLAAVVLSILLARLSTRSITELHDVVVGISEGELDRRLHWWSRDELGEIGLAINRVAEQMRERLDDVTRESEQLQAVLGSMVDGVLVVGGEGHVILANPRLRELLDFWGPIVERPWFEIIRDPEAETAIREAMASRDLVVAEFNRVGAAGRVLLLHAVGFPADGPRAGTVAVFHDVTEMRRIDQIRRDFIANASHELKTPLTAIRGFADTMIESELSDEDRDRYLEIIARNAKRMSSLVEDLLTLSRIEVGSDEIEWADVEVDDLVRVMLDDLGQRLEVEGVEVNLHSSGSAMWRTDRRAVEQVLTNLLDNALKYTDAGGHIDLTIEVKGNELAISIKDSGRGIPVEDQARIFERFYRVDAARSRAIGGTGLGLSIVKHLVQAMGGKVRVESNPGEGSCFSFTLPRGGPKRSRTQSSAGAVSAG